MQNIVFPGYGGTDSRGDEVSAALATFGPHVGEVWGGRGVGFASPGIQTEALVRSPACTVLS